MSDHKNILVDSLSHDPDFLQHYGVKGMRWGVRKSAYGMYKINNDGVEGVKLRSLESDKVKTREINSLNRAAVDVLQKVLDNGDRLTLSIEAANRSYPNGTSNKKEYYNKVIHNMEWSTAEFVPTDLKHKFEVSDEGVYMLIGTPAWYNDLEKIKHNDAQEMVKAKWTITFNDLGLIESLQFDDSLKHHGIKGMKWGVRKDRGSGNSRGSSKDSSSRKGSFTDTSGNDKPMSRRARKLVERILKRSGKQNARSARRDNSLRSNPKNRRVTDAELRRAIDRMNLEQQFAQAVARSTPKTRNDVLREILSDSGKNIAKNVVTSVGTDYLSRAARINLNKILPSNYAVAIKGLHDAAKKSKGK